MIKDYLIILMTLFQVQVSNILPPLTRSGQQELVTKKKAITIEVKFKVQVQSPKGMLDMLQLIQSFILLLI